MALQHDPWRQALAQSHSTEATQRSTDTERSSESLTTQPKPTRGHHACITELGLRFPKARDDDPESYALRMDYLAKDLAHLTVPLLRAACDRAAQSARGMPYASEILACAAAIVEERQRAIEPVHMAGRHQPSPDLDGLAIKAREYNRANADIGSPYRWTDAMQVFAIGSLGERRATRDDGSIIEPWLGEDQQWHPPAGDGPALAAAYRQHGAHFQIRGGSIVDTRE